MVPLFAFFRVFLANLLFPYEFKIFFSVAEKNTAGIFIEIVFDFNKLV